MFAVRSSAPPPDDDFWYTQFPGSESSSGARVSPETAMKLTAVYACCKVIYESIMQLPLILYRREVDPATGRESRERATDQPLYSLLHDAPNADYTAAEWREVQQDFLLKRGNAYSQLVRDGRRNVREIGPPLHPDTVSTRELGGGRYLYEVRPTDGAAPFSLNPGDMLHLRAVVTRGRLGLNPIEAEREAIGIGLAAQDFAARYFRNDAQPGGVIEHPTHFANPDDRDEFRRDFQRAYSGANRHRVAVLEYGMKFTPMQLRLRDVEFLATRKFQNLDIARIFRVPPHLIMELDRATFSNISSQGIEFVKYTLLPWMVRWEQRLRFDLQPGEEYYFEFLVDGLERGDPSTRGAFYHNAILDGWMNRNEVRQRENLDAEDGLDEFLEPRNMAEAGTQEDGGGSGEEDARFSAMRENAARATASIIERQARADPLGLIGLAEDVGRIMAVPVARAAEFLEATTKQLLDDAAINATTELPEGFQFATAQRLMEL